MGKPKYIYFTDELADKLSKEENASALICDLLRFHYEHTKKSTKTEISQKLKIAKLELETAKKIEEIKSNEIHN